MCCNFTTPLSVNADNWEVLPAEGYARGRQMKTEGSDCFVKALNDILSTEDRMLYTVNG
jgi:hypothetical protein